MEATPPAAMTGAAAGNGSAGRTGFAGFGATAGRGAACVTGCGTNSVRGQLSMMPTAPITTTAVTSAPTLHDFDDGGFFEEAGFEAACGAAG